MENSTSQNPPDNNLVWAILCTVLCCLPLGVVAIIKSTSVNSLWSQGKHAEAQKAADDTKKYAKWGAIIGGSLYIGFFIVYFLIIGATLSTGY